MKRRVCRPPAVVGGQAQESGTARAARRAWRRRCPYRRASRFSSASASTALPHRALAHLEARREFEFAQDDLARPPLAALQAARQNALICRYSGLNAGVAARRVAGGVRTSGAESDREDRHGRITAQRTGGPDDQIVSYIRYKDFAKGLAERPGLGLRVNASPPRRPYPQFPDQPRSPQMQDPVRVAVTGAASRILYPILVSHRLGRDAQQGSAGHPLLLEVPLSRSRKALRRA